MNSMDHAMAPNDLKRTAIANLRRVLPESSLEKGTEPAKASPDFVFRSGKRRFLVQLKSVRQPRAEDVLGQLAVGVLTGTSVVQRRHAIPLTIVGLPRIGRRVAARAEEFMKHHAADAAWGVCDEEGRFRLVIPQLDIDEVVEKPLTRRPRGASVKRSTSLFSDLNRWMLKILLLRDVSSCYWNGPREPVANAADLRRVAAVSLQTAHDFFNAFHGAGYLVSGGQGLEVARKGDLMDLWFGFEHAVQPASVPVRSIFANSESLQDMLHATTLPYAVGGFAACKLLGVLHAPVPRSEVHFEGDLRGVLKGWNLEVCDERDAAVWLVKAKYPRSILDGRVKVDGLYTVDILQAALDVHANPARGMEQAGHIVREVLGWR